MSIEKGKSIIERTKKVAVYPTSILTLPNPIPSLSCKGSVEETKIKSPDSLRANVEMPNHKSVDPMPPTL
jgi:hypothetical protein